MSQEAMKQALDALENHSAIKHPQQRYYRDAAIDALRAALDAPEPDYERGFIDGMQEQMKRSVDRAVRAMAALDARPIWFGLTTQEILDIVDDHTERVGGLPMLYRDQAADLSRAIEAKLKEKNV